MRWRPLRSLGLRPSARSGRKEPLLAVGRGWPPASVRPSERCAPREGSLAMSSCKQVREGSSDGAGGDRETARQGRPWQASVSRTEWVCGSEGRACWNSLDALGSCTICSASPIVPASAGVCLPLGPPGPASAHKTPPSRRLAVRCQMPGRRQLSAPDTSVEMTSDPVAR
jgi:hypothetical protein